LLSIVDASQRGAPARLANRRPFTPVRPSMGRSFPPARRKLLLP